MFEEDGPGGKAVLKPYAVPTIFKWLAEVGAGTLFSCHITFTISNKMPMNGI